MKMVQFGVVAAIGAAVLFGMSKENKYRKQAIEKWGLSEAQVAVMKECEGSLSRHERQFKENVSKLQGCACIASRATKGLEEANFRAAQTTIDLMIEASKSKDRARIIKALGGDGPLKQFPTDVRMAVMSKTMKAVGYCSAAENHHTGRLRQIYIDAKQKQKLDWQNKAD